MVEKKGKKTNQYKSAPYAADVEYIVFSICAIYTADV